MRFCFFPLMIVVFALAACSGEPANAPRGVALIGQESNLTERGLRLSTVGQQMRAATAEGLVAAGPTGDIVPAIAERWIVTDDGESYIFRLRNSTWPSGDELTAGEIRQKLLNNIKRLEGTTLGLDLAKIAEVRAMTGRVIEIRLTSPMPDFLRLLAQPEMGFVKDGRGAGPMVLKAHEDEAISQLVAIEPEMRGLPRRRNWEDTVKPLYIKALPAQKAVESFSSGDVDVVLNGHLSDFPLADLGPLSQGNVRLDAPIGVFGLLVREESGVLETPALREAISMAIDRDAMMAPFNIGGWQSRTSIVPPELWGNVEPEPLPWANEDIAVRQARAKARIAQWAAGNGDRARITIGMPEGPGTARLFAGIQRDLRTIGVEAKLIASGQGADIELYDRPARYVSPRWFLNQFSCEVRNGPCSPDADALVEESLAVKNMGVKAQLLAQAELALEDQHIFISFGSPIRWSLVRSDVTEFQENRWGVHPLFPLTKAPI